MIAVNTYLKIKDNSGGKICQCIKVFKKNKKNDARIGDIVLCSIKEISKKNIEKNKIKKGNIIFGLILRTKKKINRLDGNSIKFSENAITIVNELGIPQNTRIFGPTIYELRKKKMIKVLSLVSNII